MLDKYNIMILIHKLIFIQQFTSANNVECLHSSFEAKLLLHNCARAKKMQKHVFVAYKVIWKLSRG